MLRRVGVGFLLLLLWASAFGDQAMHPGFGSDDFMWRTHISNLYYPSFRKADAPQVRRTFLEASLGVLKAEELAGHYAPVRGMIWLTIHAIVGDESWLSATLWFGHFLHWATALLFFFWLRRIAVSEIASFMTAAVYLVHPVVGLPLSNANSGMNLYGMFFLLASLHTFENARRGSRTALFGTAVLQFLCQNSNIVFFGIGPLVLGWSELFAQFRVRREWRAWLIATTLRFIPIVLVLAVGIFLRLFFYGQMGSRDPGQTVFVEGRSLFAGLADVFLAARDAAENEGREHQVYAVPAHAASGFTARFVAYAGVGLCALAASFCVPASRKKVRDDGIGSDTALGPAGLTILGIGLFLVTAVFYWILRGGTFLHRYYHVGMLGFAPILVGVLQWPTVLDRKRGIVSSAILLIGFSAALGVFQTHNLRSASSVRYATRLQRYWSETSLRIMETDPDINRIYVLNAPRIVSPSGQVFSYTTTLSYALLNEIRRKRIEAGGPYRDPLFLCRLPEDMATDWKDLDSKPDWLQGTAVFDFDVENCRLRRVREVENPSDPDVPSMQFPVGKEIPGIDRVDVAVLPPMRFTRRDRRTDPTIARRFADSHPDFAVDAISDINRVSREELPLIWDLSRSPVAAVRAAAARLAQRQFDDALAKTVRARMRLDDEVRASAGLAVLVATEPQAARTEIEKSLESRRLHGEALWLLSEIDRDAAADRLGVRLDSLSSRAERLRSTVAIRCRRANDGDFAKATALLIDPTAPPIDRIRAARALSEAGRNDLLSEAALQIRLMASLGRAMLVALTDELTANTPSANRRIAGMILGDPSLPHVVKRRARVLAIGTQPDLDLAALVDDGFRYINFLTAVATRSIGGSLADEIAKFARSTVADDPEIAALRRHVAGDFPAPLDGMIEIRAEASASSSSATSAMVLVTITNRGRTAAAGGLIETAPLIETRFIDGDGRQGDPMNHALPWQGIEPGRSIVFPLLVKDRPAGADRLEMAVRRPIVSLSDPPSYFGRSITVEIKVDSSTEDR